MGMDPFTCGKAAPPDPPPNSPYNHHDPFSSETVAITTLLRENPAFDFTSTSTSVSYP